MDGLVYGSTWSDKVMPGVGEYVSYISITHGLPDYRPEMDELYTVGLDTLVAELERGYPVPVLGLISGAGHSWVIVGYEPGDTPLAAICSTWSDRVEWVEYGSTGPDVTFKVFVLYSVMLEREGMPALPGLVSMFGERVYLPLVKKE